MPYQVIENFKYGLDTRRSELTSQLGTLMTLENCHINQGGEVEKRKMFKRVALPTGTGYCFGLEATSTGLMTFGSALSATVGAMPTGVTYQRLQHPAIIEGVSMSETPAMTAVVATGVYGGYAWVVATFGDYGTFCYWVTPELASDGYLVKQFMNGVVPNFGQLTVNASLFKYLEFHILPQIQAVLPDLNAAFSNNILSFTPTYGSDALAVTASVIATTASATIQNVIVAQESATVAETRATCSIRVVSGTAPAYITEITVDGVSLLHPLPGYVSISYTSTAAMAIAIAAAINSYSLTSGFTAVSGAGGDANLVTISSPVGLGATANGKVLAVTTDGTISLTIGTPTSGGVTATSHNDTVYVIFGGTWAEGDTFSLELLVGATDTYVFGAEGNVAGRVPSYLLPIKYRIYAALENSFALSGIDDAASWELPDATAGVVTPQDNVGQSNEIVSLARYQGRLAALARRSVGIWNIDGDPTAFALVQTLDNVGTLAARSVQSLGDLDVLMLYDSGFRSLRVRDSSLNAFVVDIGTPIDSDVTAQIRLASTSVNLACGVVEPESNRYWCYVPGSSTATGKIFVLSYFPQSKVIAWSVYLPQYDDGGGYFQPQKFVTYNGRVYCRDAGYLYRYGGDDGNTYDTVVATAQLPWLDLKKPGTWKHVKGFDAAMTGAWSFYGYNDYTNENSGATLLSAQSVPSFNYGGVPWNSRGTHFSLKAVSSAASAAKLSSLVLYYELENDRQ